MNMQDSQILLEARNLTIWRGENLLADDISVAVPRASIVQIKGTNGSGKTTLLRAMIGLAEFDEGEIYWCGEAVHRCRDELLASLLYLGHKPGISSGLTPFENLTALCPELDVSSGNTQNLRESITNVLDELGVADRVDLPCVALSAGQQRRVSLARLRLQQAPLWVLDEPLTSLDANGLEWVRNEIQTHVTKGGAVLFTTHQSLSFDSVPVHTVQMDANP